jgi:tetratricopeptide (TPR) repeat protein
VGWFWFLWMLVPVIGLVQIGAQSIADRYSYFPSIGLSVAAVWCIAQWTGPSRIGRTLAAAIALATIASLALLSRQQLTYWQDTATLFTHAAAVTDNNWVADLELGRVAASTDPAMAAGYYSDVVRLRPTDPRGYIGLADAIVSNNPQAAQQQYAQAVHLQPGSAPLRLSYAAALDAAGQPADALVQAREAIRLDPSLPAARAAEADLLRQLAHRPEHPPPPPRPAPAPQ